MFKHKNTITLTIYTTILITSFSVLAFLLIASGDNTSEYKISYHKIILLILICSMLSFLVSSIIIDRMLNPIRIMSQRIKEIGERNFNQELSLNSNEDELKEYVDAFNEMRNKLNKYIDKQKQFISDASHELKTPITIINGHVDLLLRWGKDDKETLENELQTIKNETLAMNDLIDSLLFFARSDSDNINYEMNYTNLTDLVKDVIMQFEVLNTEFIVEKFIEDDCFIMCDKASIIRTLRIILSNCIKYCGDNKKLDIFMAKEGTNVKLQIKDYGIGIPKEYIENIFDRFYRVDSSRTKNTGGLGLGLSIAKDIIESHNGCIYAHSHNGTSIIIELPIFIES